MAAANPVPIPTTGTSIQKRREREGRSSRFGWSNSALRAGGVLGVCSVTGGARALLGGFLLHGGAAGAQPPDAPRVRLQHPEFQAGRVREDLAARRHPPR